MIDDREGAKKSSFRFLLKLEYVVEARPYESRRKESAWSITDKTERSCSRICAFLKPHDFELRHLVTCNHSIHYASVVDF